MARIHLALAAVLVAGCTDFQPPVQFVPAVTMLDDATMARQIAVALEELGYSVANAPRGAPIGTDWRFEDGLLGKTRHRLLVRFQTIAPAGIMVAAPRERFDGSTWLEDGEDEEARRYAVAAVLARLRAPR